MLLFLIFVNVLIIQLIGGVYALYSTSPEMTMAVAIILPTVIVIGTFFGSILRKLSRQAQEQVLT